MPVMINYIDNKLLQAIVKERLSCSKELSGSFMAWVSIAEQFLVCSCSSTFVYMLYFGSLNPIGSSKKLMLSNIQTTRPCSHDFISATAYD